MHQGLDWELLCCKQEATQAAPGMKDQTTSYSDPLHLLVKAWPVWKKIQQHRKRSTRHTVWNREISSLLLHKTDGYHYRSQPTSCNIQNICHNTATKTAVNSTENISIQSELYTCLDQTYLYWTGSPDKPQENKHAEIPGMQININTIQTAINIPDCMKFNSYSKKHPKMSSYNI